jgi:hypothetical protein
MVVKIEPVDSFFAKCRIFKNVMRVPGASAFAVSAEHEPVVRSGILL